jgi:Icc-related predicted phosphoesterase
VNGRDAPGRDEVQRCVRIAAVGDLHVGVDDEPPDFDDVGSHADALLLAGDLTRRGLPEEVRRLASALERIDVPVVAVLGNHDVHSGCGDELVATLAAAGVTVLEGAACVLEVAGRLVGIAGVKGFAGGMPGVAASSFGEPEMKAFALRGAHDAGQLQQALARLGTTVRIVLLHYAPVGDTLVGEPPEIHCFLGDYRLAEVVDGCGADLVLHGHAHSGREHGRTPGGVPVRNVARPVIGAPYRVYELPLPPVDRWA